ncbi:RAMP superfamily CRISPR-associated protein [Thermodesulfobium sp. 4217-1]|uniref:RAMP superfamily CRISPR-associated protein n=1 Tax=Thermodesulfobium sp. 4217-1 TaxID=3120013 RepID=UPI0032220558
MSKVEELKVYSIATDPIYIGTGGYTIGRVDNTIVRDPITKLPKIPGSSLAGTWRYYMALELLTKVRGKQPEFNEIKNCKGKTLEEKINNWTKKSNSNDCKGEDCLKFSGNVVAKITCAGQDNTSQEELLNSPDAKNKEGKTGHCGHCIVCKGFGFSKKDISWQGMLFFSDLQIVFFPVFTMSGTKWITTERILKEVGFSLDVKEDNKDNNDGQVKVVVENIYDDKKSGYINLGWLYLPYIAESCSINLNKVYVNNIISNKDIVIVPENLYSQIVNSNLEVRTSVSIDPITGAAKEGALFTSEAIPRGTIFYSTIRIFDKSVFNGIDGGLNCLPTKEQLKEALEDSKHYYETLGIGGMTTRGFGRLKILTNLKSNSEAQSGGVQNGKQS